MKSGLFELAQLAMHLDHVATEFLRFNRRHMCGWHDRPPTHPVQLPCTQQWWKCERACTTKVQ